MALPQLEQNFAVSSFLEPQLAQYTSSSPLGPFVPVTA